MYKVHLNFPNENYLNDVQDVPRAFSPYLEIDAESPNYLGYTYNYSDEIFNIKINSDILGCYENSCKISDEDLQIYKRQTKRFIKNCLYDFLSEKLEISLPYGSLTGVRPTKLYYELENKGINPEKYLIEEFKVTKDRVKLIKDCVNNQQGIINYDTKSIGLFLNIPFCPTRCNYCSFISTELFRVKNELPKYVENVLSEIDIFKELLGKTEHKLTSIYVGGGTPTCIGLAQLNALLKPIADYKVEFTVEAGRPDTISEDILDMLKDNNVTRISINPQSFNQRTLEKIGRKHTVNEIYKCYNQAVSKGFIINMDLIAMLGDETIDDFTFSVDRAIELRPHNITIHTLSLKRGSEISQAGEKKQEFGQAKQMTDYAYASLYKKGYKPYYMYRQKNTADNLENVSFMLDGCQCKYNIDMMEETESIFGIGAGAMSKFIDNNGHIERLSSPKGFREYIERLPSIIQNKRDFFNI